MNTFASIKEELSQIISAGNIPVPPNFLDVLENFMVKLESFYIAGMLNDFEDDILGTLDNEANGRDDENKERFYPGWSYENLKLLSGVLRKVVNNIKES